MKAVTLAALSVLAGAEAAETILGAFIFHRHGDRTPKALAPTNLTNLGYEQVYASGQYYRSRYLSGDSKIRGLNQDIVKLSQIAVTAPVDNVLQNSAQGFLQAFYPPVQSVQVLANGQNVQAPMDGYQLIPINTIATGAGSEDAGWLQDASSCQNAKTSSDSYFQSQEYQDLAASTKDLYSSIVPTINNVISANQVNYKNAYIVYDILNVASIHNSSIPSSNLLTNSTFNRLQTLANAHEWGLAYNASDNTRAISGMQLAGEVISHLNSTITTSGSKKLAIQFGAYATFLSFFGLADLPKVSANFTGVVDYASSMSFELFTSADTGAGFPKTDDLQVRFVFHNGTATNASTPTAYPLFGGSKTVLSWNEFRDGMDRFAVHSTQQWCQKCGETSGECAAFASKNGNANANANANAGAKGTGMSPAIGGVIGAMVTLAVVLGSLVAVMLVGGFRVVSKKAMRGSAAGKSVEPKA